LADRCGFTAAAQQMAHPFKIDLDGTRAQVIAKYRDYLVVPP
jgi:hypothetical protein